MKKYNIKTGKKFAEITSLFIRMSIIEKSTQFTCIEMFGYFDSYPKL